MAAPLWIRPALDRDRRDRADDWFDAANHRGMFVSPLSISVAYFLNHCLVDMHFLPTHIAMRFIILLNHREKILPKFYLYRNLKNALITHNYLNI
jgi:hypothetical protein